MTLAAINVKQKRKMKINFTQEHFQKMQSLLLQMLLKNEVVMTKMGQTLNIVELLHTTTISTLNSIRLNLETKIKNLEGEDEWVASSVSQAKLNKAKEQKELVNLIIGYKRYNLEAEENAKKKVELTEKLKALKESQKTPEDKIKELEAELAGIEDTGF